MLCGRAIKIDKYYLELFLIYSCETDMQIDQVGESERFKTEGFVISEIGANSCARHSKNISSELRPYELVLVANYNCKLNKGCWALKMEELPCH